MVDENSQMPKDSDETHFHEAEKYAWSWGTFWWTLSVIFHVSAVCAAIWFSPLRKWLFAKPTGPSHLETMVPAKVKRMVVSMVEVQGTRLREKIVQQKELLTQLGNARNNRYERYAQERKYMLQKGGRTDLAAVEPIDVMGAAGPETDMTLEKKGFKDLYDIAMAIEKTTYGTYRQLRSAELARLQYLSLKVAFDATTMAIPDHPAINEEVLYRVITSATDGKLDELKAELYKINSEVSSMVASAQRMLDLANELIADDAGATVGYSTGGSGPTGGGAGDDDPDPGRNRRTIFMGYSPPAPDAFAHRWGVGVGPVVHKNELYPHNAGADLGSEPPLPGRKLMKHGMKGNWMYIDTWYVVGPFPNPNRENLDKKFPPESGIDLDATYIGDKGRRLRWDFRQSYTVCVVPHVPDNYMIYYGYTEIYSDHEQDRWCIFGSDDYGKAWLMGANRDEDELIYASGKTPHPWIPDRAYKKVRFRKGYNPILFKLENAWGRTGYSMCVYMGEM